MQRFKCVKEILAGRIMSVNTDIARSNGLMVSVTHQVTVVTSPEETKPTTTRTFNVHFDELSKKSFVQMDHGFIPMANVELEEGCYLVMYLDKEGKADYVSQSPADKFQEGYVAISYGPVSRGGIINM